MYFLTIFLILAKWGFNGCFVAPPPLLSLSGYFLLATTTDFYRACRNGAASYSTTALAGDAGSLVEGLLLY